MLTLRPVRWPEDLPALTTFDTSFTTDRVYRVIQTEGSFVLKEELVDPPLHKAYPLTNLVEKLQTMDYTVVANLDSVISGFAAAKYEEWNRRVVLWHLYVAPQHRGQGIGRTLLDAVMTFARSTEARCVWLETQNINYPAIQFYRRAGFRLCGLDASLYDPQAFSGEEIALFFAYDLT
jgi:ribosomal protein S18 acetylase RimI-like enzyme